MNYSDKLIFLEDRWHWRSDDTDLKCFKGWKEENQLLNVLNKYLDKKDVMVQAGGNCGMQVDKFAKEFGMVYTFEPDPINFQCLVANLPYSNVVKIQACVADAHKLLDVDFFVDDIGSIHVKKDQGKIPTFKIDDLALSACDLIQLDVEGYEGKVLEGAIETIIKYSPVITTETLQGVDYPDVIKIMNMLAYERVDFTGSDSIWVRK